MTSPFDDFKFKIGDLVQLCSEPPVGGYIIVQRLLVQGSCWRSISRLWAF